MRRFTWLLLLALACGWGSLARAQVPDWPGLPAQDPASPRSEAAGWQQVRLSNGVILAQAYRPQMPLVTVLAALDIRDLGMNLPQAELLVSMLGKGARVRGKVADAQGIQAEFARWGAELDIGLNGSARQLGPQTITLTFTVRAQDVLSATSLLVQLLREPVFLEGQLQQQRTLTQAFFNERALTAETAADEAYAKTQPWSGSAAAQPVLSLPELQALAARVLQPERVRWVVVGDAGPVAIRHLQHRLSAWKRTPQLEREQSQPHPGAPAPTAGTTERCPVRVELKAAGQVSVLVVAPAPAVSSPQWYAARVAAAVAGAGYTARMNQEVRVRRGLAYGAGARYEADLQQGVVFARASTKPASATEVASALQTILAGLATKPLSEQELQVAKNLLIGNQRTVLSTTRTTAQWIAQSIERGWTPAQAADYAQRIAAVTPEQVRQTSARWWQAPRMRVFLAGPLEPDNCTVAR